VIPKTMRAEGPGARDIDTNQAAEVQDQPVRARGPDFEQAPEQIGCRDDVQLAGNDDRDHCAVRAHVDLKR